MDLQIARWAFRIHGACAPRFFVCWRVAVDFSAPLLAANSDFILLHSLEVSFEISWCSGSAAKLGWRAFDAQSGRFWFNPDSGISSRNWDNSSSLQAISARCDSSVTESGTGTDVVASKATLLGRLILCGGLNSCQLDPSHRFGPSAGYHKQLCVYSGGWPSSSLFPPPPSC